MGLRPLEIFLLLQCGYRLFTSESERLQPQILTFKVDPRAVIVKKSDLVSSKKMQHNLPIFLVGVVITGHKLTQRSGVVLLSNFPMWIVKLLLVSPSTDHTQKVLVLGYVST